MSRAPVWLLDFEVDGRVERFATRTVIVTTDAGVELPYREGLDEIALDLSADLNGGEVSTAVTIRADWLQGLPVGAAGWSKLVAAWHKLEGAPGTLRRWFEGQTLEGARTMLRGFAEEVEHGGPADPLVFTLRRNLFAATRPLLNPLRTVDGTTWPVSIGAGIGRDPKSEGAYIPRTFGFPGDDSVSAYVAGIPAAAVPAVLCETRETVGTTNFLAIADRADIDAVGKLIRLYDYSEDPFEADDFVVEVREDLRGQPIAGVSIVNPTQMQPLLGHAFYAGFGRSSFYGGGGELLPDRSGPIRGMADLIRKLLEEHTRADVVEIDQRLNAWLIDTFINDGQYDAWPWIQQQLSDLADFRLFEGRVGLGVRLMDWAAKPIDAVARFDVDLKQLERVSRLRTRAASKVRNRIVIEWKRDRATDKYRERYVLDATADPADPRASASLRAAVSQRRFARPAEGDDGVRELVIQTPHVWDAATIPLVARNAMARLALPPTDVTYRGPVGLEQRIDPTDPIIINESEVGLIERVALVERLVPRATDTLVQLAVLDDPSASMRI